MTDRSRRNAQARRLDGQQWPSIGGKKPGSKSLPGTEASWHIGAAEIGDRPLVLLCEGQPDFCAVLLVVWFEGLVGFQPFQDALNVVQDFVGAPAASHAVNFVACLGYEDQPGDDPHAAVFGIVLPVEAVEAVSVGVGGETFLKVGDPLGVFGLAHGFALVAENIEDNLP